MGCVRASSLKLAWAIPPSPMGFSPRLGLHYGWAPGFSTRTQRASHRSSWQRCFVFAECALTGLPRLCPPGTPVRPAVRAGVSLGASARAGEVGLEPGAGFSGDRFLVCVPALTRPVATRRISPTTRWTKGIVGYIIYNMCNNSMSTLRQVPTPLFLLGDGPVRLTGVRPPRVAGVLRPWRFYVHSSNFVLCSALCDPLSNDC